MHAMRAADGVLQPVTEPSFRYHSALGHAKQLRFCYGVLVLALLLCLGCGDSGPERGYVEGTVTLDGEPLPQAMVTFQPETGRPSYARTDDQGHYELSYTSDKKGATLGKHRITISTFVQGDSEAEQAEGEGIKGSPEKVPAKYNSSTELSREVVAGDNTIDFELSSEGEIKVETEDNQ